MNRIYDARCVDPTCSNVTEVYGKADDVFRCGVCGGDALRIISPVRCSLEGVTGDFPGAKFKWERQHSGK
jgi:Zn finger protein HypA/HybF involved in hydrogenase expression